MTLTLLSNFLRAWVSPLTLESPIKHLARAQVRESRPVTVSSLLVPLHMALGPCVKRTSFSFRVQTVVSCSSYMKLSLCGNFAEEMVLSSPLNNAVTPLPLTSCAGSCGHGHCRSDPLATITRLGSLKPLLVNEHVFLLFAFVKTNFLYSRLCLNCPPRKGVALSPCPLPAWFMRLL